MNFLRSRSRDLESRLAVAEARADAVAVLREQNQRLHEQVDSLLAHIVELSRPMPAPQWPAPATFSPLTEDQEDLLYEAQHNPNFDPNSPEVRRIVEDSGLRDILSQTAALTDKLDIDIP